LLATETREEN
jgi:hypothetical protein